MSEVNYETGRTGPIDTVANWGAREQGRPDLPAGPPPGQRGVPPRAVVALIVGGVLALLGGVAAVGGAIISAQATDPGIEFCEAIRDGQASGETSEGGQEPMTFEEYQEAREALSGSRHEEIRVPALALVDVIWQVEQLDEDAGFEALPLVGALTDSYGSLSGGCAQHGVQLPPLEALS